MPTTSVVEFTAAVNAIGSRTDSAGAAVDDTNAEEFRLPSLFWTEGALTATSFQVAPDALMVLEVGSGASKVDAYCVVGDIAGQAPYLVRLDQASVSVTVPPAEPAATRTDEIWLTVYDHAYDATGRSLPRLGYRKGDSGGAAPGPDTAWKASAKLATITVPAAATTISAGNIADNRTFTDLRSRLATAVIADFGDVAATAAAAGNYFIHDGTSWGPGIAGLIAVAQYDPGGVGPTSYTVDASFDAVDATNLAVTFTVPRSGYVLEHLEASVEVLGGGVDMNWGILNSAGGTVVSARNICGEMGLTRFGFSVYIGPLTPGASVTHRWAASSAGGAFIKVGQAAGPGLMTVTAVA